MERRSELVRAHCRVNGEQWFALGEVVFPIAGPLEVGVHAIGSIDRTTYPGAYPECAAIRFESFELWGAD